MIRALDVKILRAVAAQRDRTARAIEHELPVGILLVDDAVIGVHLHSERDRVPDARLEAELVVRGNLPWHFIGRVAGLRVDHPVDAARA